VDIANSAPVGAPTLAGVFLKQQHCMDLVEYARGVVARRSEGVIAVRQTVSLPGWAPQRNQCHDNVRFWVAAKPEHRHVFGYLVCDYLPLCWIVRPHSLVEFEDGTLVDIAPQPNPWQYPFVRHIGSEDEFAEMALAVEIPVR
jgi:hypothetical protein